jgi:hypothetical protein
MFILRPDALEKLHLNDKNLMMGDYNQFVNNLKEYFNVDNFPTKEDVRE